MWATALAVIATLVSLLAALGYLAFVSRRLDATLGALLQKQREERARLEQELDRLRATAVPGC